MVRSIVAALVLVVAGAFATPARAQVNPATVTIDDVTWSEGTGGTTNFTFTVTARFALQFCFRFTVDYDTTNDTARSPSDFTSTSGTLTFDGINCPRQLTQTITVSVDADSAAEPDETFEVSLSGATNGAVIGDAVGVGTIENDDGTPPDLTVDDVSVTEGDSGSRNATFTVELSATTTLDVTFNYVTDPDTATAGSDYTTRRGTGRISAGSTQTTIDVPVLGDTSDEPDETFDLVISNVVDANLSDGTGVGTILDDDGPTISVADNTVVEGNSGTTNAVFTVQLSAASPDTITVDYATADGTATAGSDYTSTSGTLTFANRATSQTVTVPVTGDALDEPDETFFLDLSDPVQATISDARGQATISDDDPLPSLSIADVTAGESAGTMRFTVSLSAASGRTVTVSWATNDGTALAGSDYVAGSGALTFQPGVTSQTIDVTLSGDLLDEPNETFTVDLSGPSNATLADGSGTGTITDDDAPPALSVADVTLGEGGGTMSFTVALSAASGRTVTAAYATSDGTAVSPADFTAVSGSLTFAPGVTSRALGVAIANDGLDEANETFTLSLSAPTFATIADGTATGRITDDDAPPALSIADVTVGEGGGPATFTVSLSAPSGRTVTVAYATVEGSATAPEDFTAASGTLSFAPGVTSRTFDVAIASDALDEVDEVFSVDLSGPSNATIADGSGAATITDDDDPPEVSVDDPTANEDAAALTFTVSLSAPSGRDVAFDYATSDDSAAAPDDYASASGRLTIPAEATSGTIDVIPADDALDEPDESLTLTLSAPSNATLADATGTGTIVDDDDPPSASVADVSLAEGTGAPTTFGFLVALSGPSGREVTVDWATADDSAVAPADYAAASGSLTFEPGATERVVEVAVVGDELDENVETFTVGLSNPTNANLGDASGIGTIADDDAEPAIAIADASSFEGAGALRFDVTLSAPSGRTVRVDYATSDGTADATDYTATSGTLELSAGVTTGEIVVPILDDDVVEPADTFTVMLSSPFNAVFGTDVATGTIRDDDAAPNLSLAIDRTEPWVVGETVQYGFAVRNGGTAATEGEVALAHALPTGLAFDGAGGGGWTCELMGGDVACATSAPIDVGQTSTVAVTAAVEPTARPSLVLTGTVTAGGEVDPSDDSATVQVSVLGSADLYVAVANVTGEVQGGDAIEYGVTLGNAGPSAVELAFLTITPPASLSGVTYAPALGSYDATSGEWSGLALAAGGEVVLTVEGVIDESSPSPIQLRAEVAAPAGDVDPDPTNDAALETTSLGVDDDPPDDPPSNPRLDADDGGCECVAPGAGSSGALGLVLLAGLVLRRRRGPLV
jgi:MYXO-CTERM domain-containing protein/uncharacterized repeat protein (TIGR01451 family)